jgi:hypothetical protein
MARSTQPALVLGGACLCATLAILVVGAQQPSCSFFEWMLPAILALQLCFALVAGFVTGYRPSRDREPQKAGLRTNLIAGLSGPILLALAGTAILPPPCGEGVYPIGVFVLVLVLTFLVAPVSILGGAAVGWLGGQMARMSRGPIALACTLIPSVALGLLLLAYQEPGSGVQGIVKATQCLSYTTSPATGCTLKPAKAEVTVIDPEFNQTVADTYSDANGRYQISLPPGKYKIVAMVTYGLTTELKEINISKGTYLTLELDVTKELRMP